MIPVCGCGGGNGNGGNGGGCCSPSIAASTLCMPDGSPIAVLMSTPCADCAATPADPAVVGWVDLSSGAFTPGAPPAGAVPCAGDGPPVQPCMPITSTGLCLADGTPITVIITRDCVTGDIAETGWLNLLDGTFTAGPPPAGTAPCATTIDESPAEECDQTTPVTSLGLCLADGTPIGVTIERGCDGTTTQVGWINLTTGTFTAGPPPAGTIACGESRSIQVSGVFCDVLPDGTVAGLVLVEYQYNPDGSIASVQLLDAATGQPYTLQGELSVCPTGTEPESPSEEPDIVVCADGNALLVKVCTDESPSDECRNTTTSLLCDVPTDGEPEVSATDTDPSPYDDICPRCLAHCGGGTCLPVPNAAPLWTGASVQFGPDSAPPTGVPRVHRVAAATLQAVRPSCDDGTAALTVSVRVRLDGPNEGWAGVGGLAIVDADTVSPIEQVAAQPHAPVGYQDTLTITAQVDAAKLAAGDYVALVNLETFDRTNAQTGPGEKAWTVDQFAADVVFGQDECVTQFRRTYVIDCVTGRTVGPPVDEDLDGNPYQVTGEVGQCTAAGGECCPPEPCRNTTTSLLCDVPTDGTDPDPTVTDTDPVPYAQATGRVPDYEPVAGGAAALWSGGTLSIPPDPNPTTTFANQAVRIFAATVQAPRPACDDGTVTVTATALYERTGPDPGCYLDGRLQMFVGTTVVATDLATPYAPVGNVDTLTVTAQVPAAELAAGNVALYGVVETYQRWPGGCPNGSNPDGARIGGWDLSGFTADTTFGQDDCVTQFRRTYVIDCETGQPVGPPVDTTLDGQPYQVTGEPTNCALVGDQCCPPEPCRNSSSVLVCDVPTDGTDPDPTVTDTNPDPYMVGIPGDEPVPGSAQVLWDGGTLTIPPDTSPPPDGFSQFTRSVAATIQAARPACDDDTATVTATVRVERTGPDPGCVGVGWFGLFNGTTAVAAAGVTRNTPVGHVETLTVTAQVPAADVAAGNIATGLRLETYHLAQGACPGGSNPDGARIGGWEVDQFSADVTFDQADCATQVYANVVTDCETGETLSITYTTTDGQPYTPTGEIGQCVPAGGQDEPCGDSELAELCDVTYDPQAPIATPAADFTLSGSVEVSPDGAGLWFSNADQPVDGVAELTVTGLLPGVVYEFHFDSTWIGAGGPDPSNTDAIYLLEILDGATVIATRTRNLSNGSTVFPGGTLAPDLPPLAFVAPATGQATIRFTDQTTGGGVLRDVFIRPNTVQTAMLERIETPFQRRYLYDCAGTLTGFEDRTLDGELYEPVGEVERCSGGEGGGGNGNPALTECEDGPALRVTLCDTDESPAEPDCVSTFTVCRCDDVNGNGLDAVSYTEVWCIPADGGAPTLLWTYADDPATPYTPTNPVDCDELPSSPEVTCESHILTDCGDPVMGDQPVEFVRTVCRDVAGNVVSVEDYEMDFVTPYQVRDDGESPGESPGGF